MKDYKEILQKYLPQESVEMVFEAIKKYKIHLRISKSRNTKLGDFRPAYKQLPHRISINHNLNPYSFLITFIHEIAHLVVFENYKLRTRPHGREWKYCFQELMIPYLYQNIFPEELKEVLQLYLKNPSASSGANISLARVLKKYDKNTDSEILIESLAENTIFRIHNGKTFERLEQRRKRIKCKCLDNGKLYLFDPLAKVHPLQND
jgi:hypothetical protein